MGRGQRHGPLGSRNGVGPLGPGTSLFPGPKSEALAWPTSLPCPVLGPTCVDIVVSVQGGELLAVVPSEGVASVAVVAPQPQLVILALRLQAEAGVFRKDFAARPVLHGHQQFVVALVRQPVDVLQAQPVLAVNVAKPLLRKTEESVRGEPVVPSAGRAPLLGAQRGTEGASGGQSIRTQSLGSNPRFCTWLCLDESLCLSEPHTRIVRDCWKSASCVPAVV